MVEFGLKLEDNKVSEWAQYYIDYEALKKILKNAKHAEQKKNDLVKKNPPLAKRIIQAHNNGETNYITSISSMNDFESGSKSENNSRHNNWSGGSNSGMMQHSQSNISLPTLYSERMATAPPAPAPLPLPSSNNNDGNNSSSSSRSIPQSSAGMNPNARSPKTIREHSELSLPEDTISRTSSNRSDSGDQAKTPDEKSPLLGKDTTTTSATTATPPTSSTPREGQMVPTKSSPLPSSPHSTSPPSKQPSQRQSSIQKTFSSISDHLSAMVTANPTSGSRYERNLRQALNDIDHQTKTFDTEFRNEQSKVVDFYNKELQELDERLEFVIESVAQSFGISTKSSSSSSDIQQRQGGQNDHGDWRRRGGMTVTPGVVDNVESSVDDFDYETQLALATRGANKKTVSPFPPSFRKKNKSVGQRVEAMINSLASSGKSHNVSKIGTGIRGVTNLHLGSLLQGDDDNDIDLNYDDEDEDDHKDGKKHKMDKVEYQKRVAEADSIKRSLISQYRSAKLLQNYAIINITGFVKIAKKFDKTVPEEKGKFRECLQSKNMLNDGKAVGKFCREKRIETLENILNELWFEMTVLL